MFSPKPHQYTDTRSNAAVANGVQFAIRADANAASLARILNEFARRDLIPDHLTTRRADQLEIEILVAGLNSAKTDLLAAKLRTMVDVETVTARATMASAHQHSTSDPAGRLALS